MPTALLLTALLCTTAALLLAIASFARRRHEVIVSVELDASEVEPPLSYHELVRHVDTAADTEHLKVDCVTTARVLRVVAEKFAGLTPAQRHALADELADAGGF